MKPIKANTVLPKGGNPLKPFRKQVGGWNELEFDAEVYVAGIRWLRVKGGMGERGDREDWVADVPCTASVHDYQWREPRWGFTSYETFEQACQTELKSSLERLRDSSAELESKLNATRQTLKQFAHLITP